MHQNRCNLHELLAAEYYLGLACGVLYLHLDVEVVGIKMMQPYISIFTTTRKANKIKERTWTELEKPFLLKKATSEHKRKVSTAHVDSVQW